MVKLMIDGEAISKYQHQKPSKSSADPKKEVFRTCFPTYFFGLFAILEILYGTILMAS